MMESNTKKRKCRSMKEKKALQKKYDSLPKGLKQEEAAKELDFKSPSLIDLLQQQKKIETAGPSSSKKQ